MADTEPEGCEERTRSRNLITGEREKCRIRARFRAVDRHKGVSRAVCRRHARILHSRGWQIEPLET